MNMLTLGVVRPRDLVIHRLVSIPGKALCGVWCPFYPNVPAEATGRFCRTCREVEEEGDR